MSTLNMDYNSDREKMIIPEYGRNVQNLIKYAKTLENPVHRQVFVEKIIDLIMQMHPQNKNLEDYRLKIWSHAFRIASYELDVQLPDGMDLTFKKEPIKPDPMDYPKMETRYRHYGQNIQTLIDKAKSMEEGPVRDGFVEVIGSYMKLAYRTWNKEPYVSDDIILNDLENLSDGELELHTEGSLDNLAGGNKKRKRQTNQSSGGSSNNKNQGKHFNGNKRNKRYNKRKN